MGQKRKINSDVIIGVILMLFSAFFLWESGKMHVGAARFPRLVLVTFLIMSAVLIVVGIRKTVYPALAKKSDLSFNVIRTPVMAFALIIGYLMLLNMFGFFISTAVFTPTFMIYFGMRRIMPLVLMTVSLNLFVYILFVRMLNVYIP